MMRSANPQNTTTPASYKARVVVFIEDTKSEEARIQRDIIQKARAENGTLQAGRSGKCLNRTVPKYTKAPKATRK